MNWAPGSTAPTIATRSPPWSGVVPRTATPRVPLSASLRPSTQNAASGGRSLASLAKALGDSFGSHMSTVFKSTPSFSPSQMWQFGAAESLESWIRTAPVASAPRAAAAKMTPPAERSSSFPTVISLVSAAPGGGSSRAAGAGPLQRERERGDEEDDERDAGERGAQAEGVRRAADYRRRDQERRPADHAHERDRLPCAEDACVRRRAHHRRVDRREAETEQAEAGDDRRRRLPRDGDPEPRGGDEPADAHQRRSAEARLCRVAAEAADCHHQRERREPGRDELLRDVDRLVEIHAAPAV